MYLSMQWNADEYEGAAMCGRPPCSLMRHRSLPHAGYWFPPVRLP